MNLAATGVPLVPVLVFAAVVVVIGVGVSLAYRHEKQRTAALADACLRLGFTFQPGIPKEQIPTFGTFHLFNLGHSRKGWNLMTGKADGAAASLFDYRYTTGGGKNSHTWTQTVAVFAEAGALPEFLLSPEHWWHKVGEILGHNDIDFEASPDFSKHYLLKGPDERAIRTAFGAEPLGFFAQQPGWSVEARGGKLAIYRVSHRPRPEELQAYVTEVAAARRALVHD